MKKLIIFVAAVAMAQSPDSATLERKRAEFWRLSYLQLQIAVQLQELRKEINEGAKKAGCTIDQGLEQPVKCADNAAQK
jgi:hypothetical protein